MKIPSDAIIPLKGTQSRTLAVVTIWIKWYFDQKYWFVTLKPKKEKKS